MANVPAAPGDWDPSAYAEPPLVDEITDLVKAVGAINAIRKHLRSNAIVDPTYIHSQVHNATLLRVAPGYDEDKSVRFLLRSCEEANYRPGNVSDRRAVLQHAVYIISGGRNIDRVVHDLAMRAFAEPNKSIRKKAFADLDRATMRVSAPRSLLRPPGIPTPRRLGRFASGTTNFVRNRSPFGVNHHAIAAITRASQPTMLGRFRQARGGDPHSFKKKQIAQEAASALGETFELFATDPFPQTKKLRTNREAAAQLQTQGPATAPLPSTAVNNRVTVSTHVSLDKFTAACLQLMGRHVFSESPDVIAGRVGFQLFEGSPVDALFAMSPFMSLIQDPPRLVAKQAKALQETAEEIATAASNELDRLGESARGDVLGFVHALAGFDGSSARIKRLDMKLSRQRTPAPSADQAGAGRLTTARVGSATALSV